MKAWVVRENGAPDSIQFEDVDPGTPAADQARVKVRAAAVNFPDALLVAGRYQVRPELPFVPGSEITGEIESAPDGSHLKPGQRVIAMLQVGGLNHGGYAEYADAPLTSIIPIPDGMPFEHAAAFTITYQTGYFGLHRRAHLQPGEVLLVHAGAGGVGTAAIQLGKAAGAMVIATASTPEKLEVCRAMGADHVINYKEDDFVEAVKALTAGKGADVIYDPVGGDVYDKSTKCINFEGRIVIVGFTSGRIAQAATNHLLVKNYSTVGLHWGLYNQRAPHLVPEAFKALFALYQEGKIKPYISAARPLAEAREALASVAEGKSTGKVVLIP